MLQELLAFYQTEPSLARELRTALGLNANEDITEANLIDYLRGRHGNATPETINLALIRTKIYLLIDENSKFKLSPATIINDIKHMLVVAGVVVPLGANFRDNSHYYDFIMTPGQDAQKTALLAQIMARVQRQEMSNAACYTALNYINKPKPAVSAQAQLEKMFSAITGSVNTELRNYRENNRTNFDRKLEHIDFKIFANDDSIPVDIRLPEGIKAKLIMDKLENIKTVVDAGGRRIGERLYKEFNASIRTILLDYQRNANAPVGRASLDARLKGVLTNVSVKLREHKLPQAGNELMAAIHDGQFQDSKLNRLFRKDRAGAAEDEIRPPKEEIFAKAREFFEKIKGFRNNLKDLLGFGNLPEDVNVYMTNRGAIEVGADLNDDDIAHCIDMLDGNPAADELKRRFASQIDRLREAATSLEAVDQALALINHGPEQAGLLQTRGEVRANFIFEYDRLKAKSALGHGKSFREAAKILEANTKVANDATARFTMMQQFKNAQRADKNDLINELNDALGVLDAGDFAKIRATRRLLAQATSFRDKADLLAPILNGLLAPAAPRPPADIENAERLYKELQELNTSIDEALEKMLAPPPRVPGPGI